MMARVQFIVRVSLVVLFTALFIACSHSQPRRLVARQMSPAAFTEPTALKAATSAVDGMRANQPYAEVERWLGKTGALDADARSRIEDTLEELADDSGSADLRMRLGEDLMKTDAHDLAIAPLKDAFFLRPGNFKAAALLAEAYVKAGRENEALTLARRLVGDNPHSHERWLFRAEVARRSGHTDEAMSAARRTLLIRPEVTEAKAVLGFIYLDRGNIALARKLLEEVSESPRVQQFAIKHRLGKMALDEQDYTSALRYFREALDEKSDYAPARNDLGLAYIKLGRSGEAKAQFELAVKADPMLAEAQVNLANLYIDAELDGQAKKALRAAADVGTDPGAFFLAAGRLYSLDISTSTGRAAAITYFDKAKQFVGGETRTQIERAMEKFAALPPAAEPANEPVQAADVPSPVSTESPAGAKQKAGVVVGSGENPPEKALEGVSRPDAKDEKVVGPDADGAAAATGIDAFRPSID